MSRRIRYSIQFGYACDNGNTVGLADEKTMAHEDLEFALAMVDPFNHEKWMTQVSSLRRRGDMVSISITSQSDAHGYVGRLLEIRRL